MYNAPDYDLYNGPVDPKAIKRYRLEETTRGTSNWARTVESPFLDEVIGEISRVSQYRDWRVRVSLVDAPNTWVTVLTPHFTVHGCFPGSGTGLAAPLPRSFDGRAMEEAERFVMMKLARGPVSEDDLYAAVAPLWVSTVAETADEMIADGRLELDIDGYLSKS